MKLSSKALLALAISSITATAYAETQSQEFVPTTLAGTSAQSEAKGFIEDFKSEKGDKENMLVLTLKYGPNKERVITGLKRISKPGLRVYAKKTDIPKVLGGLGLAIISTSNGIVTDKEARKLGVGGEVICYVW